MSPLDMLRRRLFAPESEPQHLLRARELYESGQVLFSAAEKFQDRGDEERARISYAIALCFGEDGRALAEEWRA